MALLAFWPAPRNEDVDRIEVLRASSAGGNYAQIASLTGFDWYDNWITHLLDEAGTLGDFYKVRYLVSGVCVEESPETAGVVPLQVTPQDVLDLLQGLPSNAVDARLVQKWIAWAVAQVERRIRMKLSSTVVTKEVHGHKVFEKIVGSRGGNKIQLRHKPVISVEQIHYRVRGSTPSAQDIAWENLDIQIEHGGDPDGYNHGVISIYPRSFSLSLFQGSLIHESHLRNAISILISYTHGFATWPVELEEIVAKYAAAQVMEIQGQAETAGLSSRSIDGYSESFTASATTTQFSALRIAYMDQIKEALKHYRKPLWG